MISAPSGCGKTSLIKALIKKKPGLVRPVSFTTRKPRLGEKNGIDYNFISEKEFKARLKRKDFLEWSRPFGNHYATSKSSIVGAVGRGKNIILSLDVNGASFMKKNFPDSAVLIYVLPPSLRALKNRLLGRSAESFREVIKRLSFAKKDMSNLKRYDYAVVNDNFGETVERLKSILASEGLKVR